MNNRISLAALISCVILALASCKSEPVKSQTPLTPKEQRGEKRYQAACASCHLPNSANPKMGPGLAGMYQKPYLPSGRPATDERVRETIMLGRRSMPGYGQVFDDEEIDELIAYMHKL